MDPESGRAGMARRGAGFPGRADFPTSYNLPTSPRMRACVQHLPGSPC